MELKMKFLVISKPRPVGTPPGVLHQMIKEAREWIKKRQSTGEIEAAYAYENGGGVVIANFASSEALQTAIWTYPMAPIIEYELYTLMDADKNFELQLQMLNKTMA
jgi:hypothetical protein